MSLRFVYGRAGCGKTRRCLNEIKERIESGAEGRLIFIVPEQYSFQAEKDLISVLDRGGVIKTEVLSFRRMAYRIFNEAGGITVPHIHPAGKCMIIYHLLDKFREKLRIFSQSADREGFVNTLSTLITEFKRYRVTPGHLQGASEELRENTALCEKLSELDLIYSEFEKTLAERYRDSDDDLTLAARKLSRCRLYNGAEIWIDGFASFTPQEYGLIGELLKKAARVTVTFCADSLGTRFKSDDTDIFRATKRAYKKLVGIAEENKISIEPPVSIKGDPPVRFRTSPELAHLERNYYAWPYKAYDQKTNDLQLFSSVSVFPEVEETARSIIRLCRDRGMRFRDIAVVTRDLESYEKIIEVVFTEYGIPFFIDRKVDIMNHPLIRLVLSMLDIFIENWSYESVFRYLKTGLTGVSRNDIDKLENYVLACGIRGNGWTSENKWDMSPELIPDEKADEELERLLEEVNDIRALVTKPLLEFRRKSRGRKNAAEFCGCLYDFLCNLGVPEKIQQDIEKFKNEGQLVLAGEYSQVWNTLMEVFDQTVEVMGDETFGVERFSRILKIGLGQYQIGLIPAALDQVLVGSIDRSRSHEVKALYILGVNDGVFPSATVREGILSDNDRAALNHIGLELAGDSRAQAFDEQYLIYRALSIAGGYLRISWPIADGEGKSMRPSTIISRLRKLFPHITETSNIIPAVPAGRAGASEYSGADPGTSGVLSADNASEAAAEAADTTMAEAKAKATAEELKLITGKNAVFHQMISALRKKADGYEIHPLWREVWQWFCENEEWREKCEKAKKAFNYKNLAGSINEEKVLKLYGDPAVSSVSRFEKYTACPFSFYVQYGLGARERKIYRLSPPDVGTFMHAAIERFSRLVLEENLTWRDFDRNWCAEKVSGIVDEMLKRMRGSGIAASRRYTALASRLKRVVTRSVWLIAEQIRRSSFNPVDYEAGFGEGEKYPPITIELDSGRKISLSGRIDRVDALKTEQGTYLCIIDYKSGTRDFKLSDVYYGLQIQLITYLDAIWESGEGKSEAPVYPAGMMYFKIDDPIIRGDPGLTEQDIETAVMKQLKMKGLLLADVKLIKEMDNTIRGSSMIIPATVNNGDVLGKNTSGATMEQFKLLRKYVKRLLKNLGEEIMKGGADIRPYKKKGTTACRYCSFLPVCQFDPALRENSYRMLYDRDGDEIWRRFEKADGDSE